MVRNLFFLFFLCTTLVAGSQVPAEISLEDIFYKGTFNTKSVPGFNFLKDGLHYTQLRENRIEEYDLTTGKLTRIILDGRSVAEDFEIEGYEFSKDENLIILMTDKTPIYRRSYTARYVLYDLNSGNIQPVANMDHISYAEVNVQKTQVAFVQDNNIYLQDLSTLKVTPVTTDGEKNKIINGMADWVYEEEFSFTKAFFWSPDGLHLAYMRFDETSVREFTMTLYNDDIYPEYRTFKYPNVGEENARVSAHIFHLDDRSTSSAEIGELNNMYIPRIHWSNHDNKLCVYKMNRHQNRLQIYFLEAKTGEGKIILEEENKYYIDIHDHLTFIDDGKCFLWTSEKDGFNHIYLYTINGREKRQLTRGPWEVTDFYGYDEKRDWIYYQSSEPGSMERNIYRINKKGTQKELVAGKPGVNGAQFSSTHDYYVLQHSSSTTPPSYIVYNQENRVVRPLENNEEAQLQIKSYQTTPVELMSIETSQGTHLNAAFIYPENFDEDKSYPLLMYLYGGPGSQQVMNSWNSFRYFWWFQYLAKQGYAIAIVDNRGTGGRGEEFKKMTYLQLGKYETIDQIEAARWWGKKKYIDANRIGIFGWSYGGYMSSLCLLKGNDVFKAAIAVAPVTNWKWYDSIYTERYMRTEEENPDGYRDNAPVYFADRLKGNYLLIHGLADDNVHFQNTAEMANALIKANKQFDTYFYPNKNHGIYGGHTRLHLFTKITDFVLHKI